MNPTFAASLKISISLHLPKPCRLLKVYNYQLTLFSSSSLSLAPTQKCAKTRAALVVSTCSIVPRFTSWQRRLFNSMVSHYRGGQRHPFYSIVPCFTSWQRRLFNSMVSHYRGGQRHPFYSIVSRFTSWQRRLFNSMVSHYRGGQRHPFYSIVPCFTSWQRRLFNSMVSHYRGGQRCP